MLLNNPMSRFLKRYALVKFQSALMVLLTVIFLGLLYLRVPSVEPLMERGFLELTGYLSLMSQSAQEHVTFFLENFSSSVHSERIKTLERENALLKNYFLELKILRSENKMLQKMARLLSLPHFTKAYTAKILTSPVRGWNQMFLVSAGKVHGIKRGQPVVCLEGIVGRVDSVSEHFCRIMPLTHPDFRIPVWGLKSKIQGILAGNGSENLFLIYLQDDHPVQDKEIFISSNQGGTFPENHLVGQLIYTPQKRPIIKSFIPWSKLKYIQIIVSDPILPKEALADPPLPETIQTKVSS